MSEHLTTTAELFQHRLESALEMEHDSLRMLGELGDATTSEDLKRMFAHHSDETREQIANLEEAFSLLGVPADTSPSPTTKGMEKQTAALLQMSDEPLRDEIVIAAALGTEHYEISAYQSLIITASAMGAADIATLLSENLEQEQHTSEELAEAAERHAAVIA